MHNLIATAVVVCATILSGIASAQTFSSDPMNVEKVIKRDGVWTLVLTEGSCNPRDYGDGRGESDCTNGNLASRISTRKDYFAPAAIEYSFEVLINSDFEYQETQKYRKLGSIILAEWGRANLIKNHMYEMHMTPSSGVFFERKRCFGPERYGEWNSVSILAKWANDDSGILQVTCNGKVVFSKAGPNLVPDGCGTDDKPHCDPKFIDLSKEIYFKLGPKFFGFGSDWRDYGRTSPFLPFPPNGVKVQIKHPKERKVRM